MWSVVGASEREREIVLVYPPAEISTLQRGYKSTSKLSVNSSRVGKHYTVAVLSLRASLTIIIIINEIIIYSLPYALLMCLHSEALDEMMLDR